MNYSDQEHLLNYARHRDAESFAAIVNQYQTLVFATSMRLLANRADAEDVTQEVFLSLARNARQISSENIGGWLHRCAVNAANSFLRRSLARKKREKSVAIPDCKIDSVAEWRQVDEVIDACLTELSDENRELIIQRFFINRTQSELAGMLGIGQATVSRRIKKAVDQLRQLMASKGIKLTLAASATFLMEHASAASVPSSLTTSLTKIGVVGVGESSTSVHIAKSAIYSWKTLAIAIAAMAAISIVLFPRYAFNDYQPTSSVAAFVDPLSLTVVTEVDHLDYTSHLSFSEVSMNDRGHIALVKSLPEEGRSLHVFGKKRVKQLVQLADEEHVSLAMGPRWLAAVNINGRVSAIDDKSSELLTVDAEKHSPPSMNQDGWLTYVEMSPKNCIRLASEGEVQTVLEAGDQFISFDQACLNDKGSIAFLAETSHGTKGIFVIRERDIAVVVETGGEFKEIHPGFDFNNHGQVAFVAQLVDGTQVIYTGNSGRLEQIARSGKYFSKILQVSLNDAGLVAFTAKKQKETIDSPIAGLYLWDGTQIFEALVRGQSAGDKILEGVLLWRDSLNNAGQIAVLADFARRERAAILRLKISDLEHND